jgi:hypothetical protein
MKLPRRAVLGNQDQVPTGGNPAMQPHPLAQQALDPVSNDRVPHFLGDRQAEPPAPVLAASIVAPPLRDRKDMPAMVLCTARLHREELGAAPQPHLLGDARRGAARHEVLTLLLCDGDRYPLAALGSATAENFTSTAGFLARTEPMRPLATLVMWLVGTLHGLAPPCGERDRYSRPRVKSSQR